MNFQLSTEKRLRHQNPSNGFQRTRRERRRQRACVDIKSTIPYTWDTVISKPILELTGVQNENHLKI